MSRIKRKRRPGPNAFRVSAVGPVLLLCVTLLSTTASAAPLVYDLAADWSNTTNPNGAWTYQQGNTPLPHVASWLPLGQQAWAPAANILTNFVPGWFKTEALIFGLDFLVWDIGVHSRDPANGGVSGAANVIWTAPSVGVQTFVDHLSL